MNTTRIYCVIALLAVLVSGCASPKYQPVSQIPPGYGVVYIYANQDAAPRPNNLTCNGKRLAGLGPEQYVAHLVAPGTNSYGFQTSFTTRGGLIGLLVDHHDPDPTLIRVKEGKSYYVRVVGFGMGASLWRVEETTALNEIKECHLVKTQK